MDIVDTHGHLGLPTGSSGETTEAEVLAAMDAQGVATPGDAQSLQPDERLVHDRVARFAAANPGRIFGMASISPLGRGGLPGGGPALRA